MKQTYLTKRYFSGHGVCMILWGSIAVFFVFLGMTLADDDVTRSSNFRLFSQNSSIQEVTNFQMMSSLLHCAQRCVEDPAGCYTFVYGDSWCGYTKEWVIQNDAYTPVPKEGYDIYSLGKDRFRNLT